MQVSLQSKVYLGTCIAINVYAAYSNPTRLVTVFAIGVLMGTLIGHGDRRDARTGYQPGNNVDMKWDANKDKKFKEDAVKLLAYSSMPNIFVTAYNALALGLISQRIHLPSGWNPKIGIYFCDFAAFNFGTNVGLLFQLDILRRAPSLEIRQTLSQTTI